MVRRRISEAQRWQIIGMRSSGLSYKAIGRQMGHHYTVVSRLVRKHIQTNNVKDLPRSGRPLVKPQREDRVLQRLVRRMPFATSPVLKREWLPHRQLSTRTLRNRLKSAGLKSRRVERRPMLTDRHQQLRLVWCLARRARSCDDVAIIGAGIAGTYAGWRLRNLNKQITVYEYSNRVGGRCYTMKFPDIPHINVELGAMRFTATCSGASADTTIHVRGAHLRYKDLGDTSTLTNYFRMSRNQEMFTNYTDVLTTNVPEDAKRFQIKDDDGLQMYKQSINSLYHKFLSSEAQNYIRDTASFISLGLSASAKIIRAVNRLSLESLNWKGLHQPHIREYITKAVKDVSAGKFFLAYNSPWWRRSPVYSKYAISDTPLKQTYDFGTSKANPTKSLLLPMYNDGNIPYWNELIEREHGNINNNDVVFSV
ncbi:unnamed protein product [Mytilus edulis]|uniref:Transposase Tc1-like domain-containing protein n=1 Tax=Mytilus edulis TaxID=6550 RepID=A0A8S3PMK1_MYTED|nr:unnamed protein product [Mytilus edulis]